MRDLRRILLHAAVTTVAFSLICFVKWGSEILNQIV